MTKRLTAVAAVLCLASWGMARAQEGFGLWTEAGVTKRVARGVRFSVEGDFRMADNLKQVDRWDLGVGADVRLLSFLRLGASYIYLADHTAARTKLKYDEVRYDDGEYVLPRNSYAAYNSHRHRFCMDLTGTYAWRRFTFSLRERYQYTYQGARSTDRLKDELHYSATLNPETGGYDFVEAVPIIDAADDGTKDYDSNEKHALRQRVKVEYNTRKCKIDPYATAEIVNELDNRFSFKKMRFIVGAEYKVNKRNSFNVGYVYQRKFGSNLNLYALSVGYALKLK